MVIREGEQQHALLLCLHHIVSDGWSMGVLMREFGMLYGAYVTGATDVALPPLPIQYADYAHWQRGWLRDQVLDAQAEFWAEQLSDLPALLELPTDRVRPPQKQYLGGMVTFELPSALVARIEALSRDHGATLFMSLLAVFQLLLARLSGKTDFAVGTPTAHRTHSELEGLIGFFANTLVIRSRVNPHDDFIAHLQEVRRRTLGAYEHQDLPIEAARVSLERSLSYTPLFQTMFSLNNALGELPDWPGMRLTAIGNQGDDVHAKFDVSVDLRPMDGGGFWGVLVYDKALFDAATMHRWAQWYVQLVESVLASPRTAVGTLALMTGVERQCLLEDWSRVADTVSNEDLVARFERKAQSRPDGIALIQGERSLTYAELDRRSNQLAHALIGLGVGPESIVAIAVPRSFEMLIGALGVWKAGAAYLPMDLSQPAERLDEIAVDSGVSVVLQMSGSATDLPIERLCLDEMALADQPQIRPAVVREAGQLAYVIYTSGSTGRPKGVMVTHAGVRNQISAFSDYLALTETDRVLQFANFSFDTSVEEIFAPLSCGAALVLRTEEWLADADIFWTLCEASQITIVDLPAQFFNLIAQARRAVPLCVRCIVSGGEAIGEAALQAWFSVAGYRPALFNTYGPTETTISVAVHVVTAREGDWRVLGRPIANTEFYLLDTHLEPVPIGVSGELFVGGLQVARGYHGRPDLTAERFVPDPFLPGARLYRTGDLARWRADGTLEYLGRNDHQVKLRGYRIELGEIESRLCECSGIAQALALVREDVAGDKRLVAYVSAQDAAVLEAEELKGLLSRQLPGYMVPSAIVVLAAFPLTANGKIDRKALPAPERGVEGAGYVAPRTAAEVQLAQVWGELLGVDPVSVESNFFALGGHSLLAVRMISQVRSLHGWEISIRQVFETPTIAGLAATLGKASSLQAPPLRRRETRDAVSPLSFAQQRLWFLWRLEGPSPTYNIPLGLRLHGRLSVAAVIHSLRDIVQRHEALRTRFVEVDGEPQQVVEPSLILDVPVLDVSALSPEQGEAQVRRWAQRNAHAAFDLEQAPLLRAMVIREGEQQHALLLCLHHIVSDGWSMGVLMREFGELYAHYADALPVALAELPIQYPDYAQWQRGWLREEVLEAQAAYWVAELADVPALLELPTDRVRPAQKQYRGGSVPVALPASLVGRLEALARGRGATLFMGLLAGFQVLLARLSGQADFAVGTPSANRSHSELEGLIGFFVNTLVIRSGLNLHQGFAAHLDEVRRRTLGAYEHQDLPFEQLVDRVNPERSLSYAPLFQAMFSLNNAVGELPSWPGMRLEGIAGEAGVQAKFDVSLDLQPGADGGVSGALIYDAALFDAATVQRWAQWYGQLLESALASVHMAVGALTFMTHEERAGVLTRWNATARPLPDLDLLMQFERCAELQPDRPAIAHSQGTLSYAELDRRSNRLAHELIQRGIGAEMVVGLCLSRSPELLIAMLAVWKAGAAYLPLDPEHPAERLAQMLADSDAVLTLVSPSTRPDIPGTCLTVAEQAWASQPMHRPARSNDQSRLAYVIYTSGSTGRPKGVMVTQASVTNLGMALRAELASAGVELIGRWGWNAPYVFDASVQALAGLGAGMTLCLLDDAHRQDPEALMAYLEAQGIDLLDGTPAQMELLKTRFPQARLPALLIGGEAIAPSLWAWLAKASQGRAINVYGPTECTVDASAERIDAQELPNVGHPLSNTQLYVLNEQLEPAPVNSVGELYIGGVGVARGYTQRPDLTADRFVPSPFDGPGARLYRTGDRVRWLASGRLDYLGRLDHQVKLRGYRIELGEVESRLREQ
ncbi:non-ribosomal peptide synthetase, partial [Xanthomonas bonasiae]